MAVSLAVKMVLYWVVMMVSLLVASSVGQWDGPMEDKMVVKLVYHWVEKRA